MRTWDLVSSTIACANAKACFFLHRLILERVGPVTLTHWVKFRFHFVLEYGLSYLPFSRMPLSMFVICHRVSEIIHSRRGRSTYVETWFETLQELIRVISNQRYLRSSQKGPAKRSCEVCGKTMRLWELITAAYLFRQWNWLIKVESFCQQSSKTACQGLHFLYAVAMQYSSRLFVSVRTTIRLSQIWISWRETRFLWKARTSTTNITGPSQRVNLVNGSFKQ